MLVAPLYDLLKKAPKICKINWTAECELIFAKLKTLLTTTPILSHFLLERVTVLITDSSYVGAAGVLTQIQEDKKLTACAYYSHKFDATQKSRPVWELELLAIIYCLKEWARYLIGAREVIICTDSKSVTYLLKLKKLPPKLLRWTAIFAIFRLKFRHIAGSDNSLADMISRSFKDEGYTLPLANKSTESFPEVETDPALIKQWLQSTRKALGIQGAETEFTTAKLHMRLTTSCCLLDECEELNTSQGVKPYKECDYTSTAKFLIQQSDITSTTGPREQPQGVRPAEDEVFKHGRQYPNQGHISESYTTQQPTVAVFSPKDAAQMLIPHTSSTLENTQTTGEPMLDCQPSVSSEKPLSPALGEHKHDHHPSSTDSSNLPPSGQPGDATHPDVNSASE